jgi:hypothetical protein
VAGSNGVNAYTTLTASLTLPAADGVTQVTASVANSSWMVPGQYIDIPGLVAGQVAVMQVVSKPSTLSVILVYPAFVTNAHAGDVITAGTGVSPGGSGVALVTPVSIANGGTGSSTKTTAQTALGLGQDGVAFNGDPLAYTITNALTSIPSVTVTAPRTGKYAVLARVTVDDQGVTFAANRNLTLKVKNNTTAADLGTTVRNTGTPTTAQFISVDYVLPFNFVTLTVGDVVVVQAGYNTVPSAGTSVISSASLILIPLRDS